MTTGGHTDIACGETLQLYIELNGVHRHLAVTFSGLTCRGLQTGSRKLVVCLIKFKTRERLQITQIGILAISI